MNRESTPIPKPVAQLQRQLEQFRSSQPERTKLLESLWQAAVELARQHGVHPVARPLRLDYTRLKKRLGVIFPAAVNVTEDKSNLHATFLLNFADELRRRVPVGK